MPTPTAQETFVSNMSALATAIKDKTGASLPLSIVGMTEAINTLAFEPAKIVALDFSGGITAQTVTPDAGYTHLQSVYIQKPTDFESYIRHGSTVAGVTGNYTYVSQNAATSATILNGYKAFVNGGAVMTGNYSVGTYEVASTAIIFSSAGTSSYVMSKTVWSTNAASKVTIWRPADLVASKIAPGATIFGVAGTYETATVPLAITLNFSDGTDVTYNPPSGQHYSQVTVAIPMAKASIASIIAQGKSLMGINGNYTNDATATAATILYSNTAYVKGSKITGTYKISTVSVAAGTLNFSASTTYNVAIPSGYNAVSAITVSQPTNLTAGNIKAGVTIAGILGTFTNPGNLSAVSGDTHGGTEATGDEIITKDLINNKIAYSKGKKYKGNYWVGNYNASVSDFVFLNDSSTLTITINNVSTSDAASSIVMPTASALGLIASNIKKDITIMGITGTYDNYPTTQTKTVTFSGSGQQVTPDSGKVLTKVTINAPSELVAANIKQGASIAGVNGNFTASDSTSISIVDSSLSGTWTSANILSGKTAYLHGHKVEGTITSKAATTYYTSTSNQKVDKNQYLTGDQTILAVMTSNLDGANIRYGATVKVGDSNNRSRIAEVDGTYSYVSASAADASKILSGYKAFVNGGSVMTGTYKVGSFTPPNGSITFNASNQYTITSTDYSAMTSVILNAAALSGWDAAKIAQGKSIGGVSGSYSYVASNAADASKILTGYKAFVNGGSVMTGTYKTGTYTVPANTITLSNGGTIDISSSSLNAMTKVTINTDSIVGLSADKIRYNQSIAGISGLYTSDGTATAAYIISGKVAYSKGTRYVGTAPSEEDIYTAINAQTFGS